MDILYSALWLGLAGLIGGYVVLERNCRRLSLNIIDECWLSFQPVDSLSVEHYARGRVRRLARLLQIGLVIWLILAAVIQLIR